jgi:hypothetical protein
MNITIKHFRITTPNVTQFLDFWDILQHEATVECVSQQDT